MNGEEMPKFRNAITSVLASSALVAGGLFFGPAANAAEAGPATVAGGSEDATVQIQDLTPAHLDQVIAEARAAGYVDRESVAQDGTQTTTINLGEGFSFDLVNASSKERIGAGSDSKGVYVSFNATDQNMIISGSAFALGAAVCAVSGGTFCVVVGAILTAATVAITGSGAIRCGSKSLRVYPFAGGKVKPRCV